MTWTASVPLKGPWSCRRRKEEDDLKAKRASLADETFEMLMFMRATNIT